MRWLSFCFGAAVAGTALFAALPFIRSSAEPPTPTMKEVRQLTIENDVLRNRYHRAERDRDLSLLWRHILSERLRILGTPQSWPGPTVSTITILIRPESLPEPDDVALPELIPAPKIPFPILPREGDRP